MTTKTYRLTKRERLHAIFCLTDADMFYAGLNRKDKVAKRAHKEIQTLIRKLARGLTEEEEQKWLDNCQYTAYVRSL